MYMVLTQSLAHKYSSDIFEVAQQHAIGALFQWEATLKVSEELAGYEICPVQRTSHGFGYYSPA
jgi:hypothetical protein